MREIDKDGLILCDIQSRAFELSIIHQNSSSEIFIRRFMNSKIAKELDSLALLESNLQAEDLIERIDEQYGVSDYGSIKYTANELHWIGYIYRYFAYTYERTSVQVYKTIKPKELRNLYFAYHTMDPAKAIDRILEAKGKSNIKLDINQQYEIYKRIRLKSKMCD